MLVLFASVYLILIFTESKSHQTKNFSLLSRCRTWKDLGKQTDSEGGEACNMKSKQKSSFYFPSFRFPVRLSVNAKRTFAPPRRFFLSPDTGFLFLHAVNTVLGYLFYFRCLLERSEAYKIDNHFCSESKGENKDLQLYWNQHIKK